MGNDKVGRLGDTVDTCSIAGYRRFWRRTFLRSQK